ncbi:unnamed protein product [Auanema sp. JU1783]|nr:unnamed protein product [Auanema sp. JU1783]
MLHRSPSGAKRKIRQRRDENGSVHRPFINPSSSNSSPSESLNSSNTSCMQSEDSTYRSLIDSGSYQSILPDIQPPQPRLRTSISSSMSSLEMSCSSSSTLSNSSTQCHSKPTVQVHPMPMEERSLSKEELPPARKEKPLVPAKPKGLLVDHLNRSTSLSSLSSYPNTSSSAFLSNLIGSPSLISLQEAYEKTSQENSHEFLKLEERRQESISQVSRRITTFRETKEEIEEEQEVNEQLGKRILGIIERKDPILANKLRRHLENNTELVRMETKLAYQMEKVVNHLRTATSDQSDALLEETHLRRRLKDANVLRNIYDRRERDLDCLLLRVLTDDEYRMWDCYKDKLTNIIRDAKDIDDRLVDSKNHLNILNSARSS